MSTHPAQLDLFGPAPIGNPFLNIQGANLFGLRAVYTGFCDCTQGFLERPGYGGGAA